VVRDRGAAFQRFSRAVDGPLTVLALAMIPLIVLPLVMDLSPGTEAAVLAIDMLAMPEALAIVALIAVAVAVALPVVAAVRLHRHRERPVARSARLGWLA
jgi:hypothetical protein